MNDSIDELPNDDNDVPPPVEVDMVTSEVNPFLVIDKSIKPLHHPSNVVAKLLFSLPVNLFLSKNVSTGLSQAIGLDADGDLEVPRSSTNDLQLSPGEKRSMINSSSDQVLFIEHVNSTTLDLVAHQIWRGGFLMADFILTTSETYFSGRHVLELGCGTGIGGIVGAIVAKRVVITDLDDSNILGLVQTNLRHNAKLLQAQVKVTPLNFLNLSWTKDLEEEVAAADVLIAADVVYHDRITDGFVSTIQKCLRTGYKSKDVFIALEKRFVFTLSDLDVVAPSYDHFVELLENTFGFPTTASGQRSILTHPNGNFLELTLNQISLTNYPVHFNYEPSHHLILWHIQSKLIKNV